MPEGPGHQHDLSPVMPLVRDEIAKDVPHIQWQVAPHVGSGRRDRPAVLTTELQQAGDAVAAAPQRGQELPGSDPVPIDRPSHGGRKNSCEQDDHCDDDGHLTGSAVNKVA